MKSLVSKEKILAVQSDLLNSAIEDHFAGYDPFDGLNSKLFEFLPFKHSAFCRLAWLQLHKRSPFNFRSWVGIEKKRNPKGVALFILGLLEDYKRTNKQSYLQQSIELADWLLTQQSDVQRWNYPCWGYHFDWQARAFYVPKGKPNMITTVYVSRALLALGELINDEKYTQVAYESAYFIAEKLLNHNDGRSFFSYIPGEDAFVHNASLWGAAWLGEVSSKTNNEKLSTLAKEVANSSVAAQSENGSWVYGERHHHQFIDGFHTGYNLEALSMLRESLKTSDYDDCIEKGLQFYKEHFFDDDGAAKYYQTNRYPLDMHSVAQAIITLQVVNPCDESEKMQQRMLHWSLKEMYLPTKKRFMYQKNRRFNNHVDYMRWTQAWVYYSFAMYNATSS